MCFGTVTWSNGHRGVLELRGWQARTQACSRFMTSNIPSCVVCEGAICHSSQPHACCMPLPQATATRLSALLLAAHQPLWSLWNLAAFTNTPLEQAALAFLPSARGEEERRETAALLLAMVSRAECCC